MIIMKKIISFTLDTPTSVKIIEAQDGIVRFVPDEKLILTCVVADGRPHANISWKIDDSRMFSESIA